MGLSNSKIILVVSGGIAAYKAADLASRLRKAGAEVRVAMTRAAREFVAPLTFEAISGHPVYDELFGQPASHRMEHIEWARWADAVIVAPASADFIAKAAHGISDDAPLALLLAYRGSVWMAPAMNTAMWEHPATQANLALVKSRGVHIIGPGAGSLACGEIGEGRMAEPADCVAALEQHFGKMGKGKMGTVTGIGNPIPVAVPNFSITPLAGKTVLLTAGPTRESLDPIRFISNRSSGRMGVALAEAAIRLGAKVILIHGPLSTPLPTEAENVSAESATAMLEAVQKRLNESDVAIFAAAVANYHMPARATGKIKGGETLELKLARTPDIAAWAGAHRRKGQYMIGFCAESENLIESARAKLKSKKMDLVVANAIGVAGVGFESATNEVTLVEKTGTPIPSGNMPKSEIADWIFSRILERMG